MTSGKLHAGIVHLRRLARAHAAGEMSTADYRRRRRAYIESCRQADAGATDDVTVPRSVVTVLETGQSPDAAISAGFGRDGSSWIRVTPLGVLFGVLLGVLFGVALLVTRGGHLAG